MRQMKSVLARLRRRIETITRTAQPAPLFSPETVLQLLSLVYGGAITLRARLYEKGVLASRRLPCRVVSVGNLIAGGTGKTPMTIFVAQLIHDLGYRVVVLSRGYQGRRETTGGIVSDGQRLFLTAEDAGDEPFLMARVLKGVPVVVGRQRYQAGLLAIRNFDPDVIVLDDAFQHLKLKRDLDLVLLDHRYPFGNGHLLPRGVLCEPISALGRAHSLVFTRSDGKYLQPAFCDRWSTGRPVFYTAHTPVIRKAGGTGDDPFLTATAAFSSLKGKRVLAFAGLADNDQFFASLEKMGCEIALRRHFKDHHHYLWSEIDGLMETAQTLGVDRVVTTLKDLVKIDASDRWPLKIVALDVKIALLEGEKRFQRFVQEMLNLPEKSLV